MTGFIEVTDEYGYKELFNVSHIISVCPLDVRNTKTAIYYRHGTARNVCETYEEVKRLIAQSMY